MAECRWGTLFLQGDATQLFKETPGSRPRLTEMPLETLRVVANLAGHVPKRQKQATACFLRCATHPCSGIDAPAFSWLKGGHCTSETEDQHFLHTTAPMQRRNLHVPSSGLTWSIQTDRQNQADQQTLRAHRRLERHTDTKGKVACFDFQNLPPSARELQVGWLACAVTGGASSAERAPKPAVLCDFFFVCRSQVSLAWEVW